MWHPYLHVHYVYDFYLFFNRSYVYEYLNYSNQLCNIMQGCKSRGIKLCGALAAAGMIASWTSKNLPEHQREKYAVITLVDCRSILDPVLCSDHLGRSKFLAIIFALFFIWYFYAVATDKLLQDSFTGKYPMHEVNQGYLFLSMDWDIVQKENYYAHFYSFATCSPTADMV